MLLVIMHQAGGDWLLLIFECIFRWLMEPAYCESAITLQTDNAVL